MLALQGYDEDNDVPTFGRILYCGPNDILDGRAQMKEPVSDVHS